jgi:ASC-1-like (ASCH) protein
MEEKEKVIKKSGTLNPDKLDLTVEKLKTFNGFENITDEEAQETVFAIQTLANIFYEYINEKAILKKNSIAEHKNEKLKIAA